ncbi:hypothetical protein OG331_40855 [Streptomyces sp. NBC_01017]|uniref:hypothetical protein n=1 Tax=Streptomyces sp. NBC_01017 TaxID=2903721 RepID=UPI0038683125|nr:hypothetical protein OG331_40855 [Streptomyces sp. NBC_01017]
MAQRARTNADVIRCMAAGGDPVYTALEPVVADLDQAAREVDLLPGSFWLPPDRGHGTPLSHRAVRTARTDTTGPDRHGR